MGPVIAPLGTAAASRFAEANVTGAGTPLIVTELADAVVPKFIPSMVTVAPTGPEVGLKLPIIGAEGITVKLLAETEVESSPEPLLYPVAVDMGPVVALFGTTAKISDPFAATTVAGTPLKATVR